MFHNNNCYIDSMFFDKKGLLERCLEMYWFNFSFNFLLGVVLFFLTHPNMLLVPFIRWFLVFIVVVNIIILNKIERMNLKINRIFNNGKIIQSNVVRELSYEKIDRCLFVGRYHICSMYFDCVNGENVAFYFKGHIDRPVHITKPFKQGEDWRDLKTINVLVNADDYNDYFVLFREELNIDTTRRRSYGPINIIDYILWYGSIIFLICFTH